ADLGFHSFLTPVHFVTLRRDMNGFESAAAILTYSESGADIGSGDDVRRIRVLPISADYFDVVRVRPAIGRGFSREDERAAPNVVISHHLWQELYGNNTAIIGSALTMSGAPFTIVGVMPEGYVDPIAGTIDAWVPLDLTPGNDPANANNHYLTA